MTTGCWIMLIAGLSADPAIPRLKTGDVAIVVQIAEIREGDRVLQRLHPGVPLTIEALEKGRYWVSHEAAGWIDAESLAAPELAVGIFSRQILAHPDSPEGYAARGAVLTILKRYPEAIRDYDELVRLAPEVAASFGCRATCRILQRDFDRALADYTEAIRLDPENAVMFNDRASAWLQKLEFDKSIADANTAARLAPRLESIYAVRATAWAGKREFVQSQADCETAHRLNPRSGTGFNAVGWFLATNPRAELRDGAKALEFALRACEVTKWQNAGH
ncbi:MAG: hypothetical protein JSS02_14845, partial [Planctomycetes bacterium]|nr:hypothetical protein [Planctomycetota bacterium]